MSPMLSWIMVYREGEGEGGGGREGGRERGREGGRGWEGEEGEGGREI